MANPPTGDYQAKTPTPQAPKKAYWGCHDTPLGPILIAISGDGLCRLEFVTHRGLHTDMQRWKQEWPETEFIPDAGASANLACRMRSLCGSNGAMASVALYGHDYQLNIWKTMLQIGSSQSPSFKELANLVSHNAEKAVALASHSMGGNGQFSGNAKMSNPLRLKLACAAQQKIKDNEAA